MLPNSATDCGGAPSAGRTARSRVFHRRSRTKGKPADRLPEEVIPQNGDGLSDRLAPRGLEESYKDIGERVSTAAFAFRGYDVTNVGRGDELLRHPAYGRIVRSLFGEVSAICSEALGVKVDLAARVLAREPSSPETFAADAAIIIALSIAQLRLLEEFFDVTLDRARLSFGYSVGEVAALVAGGVYQIEQVLPVLLDLAGDCAELAADTHMGVLFTRGAALHADDVERLCRVISGQGHGLIGPSAYLSPNAALLLGQGGTLDRLERELTNHLPVPATLRRKPKQWPPLHSPLVWQRNIPNRAAMALYRTAGGMRKPTPPIISCVTGEDSYDEWNSRDILIDWTDHPQRLWDAIDRTLASGVQLVIHVGPEPKLIRATFDRLSRNVLEQLKRRHLHHLGHRVIPGLGRQAWLTRLLPFKTALLWAPFVDHLILEDWLLEQDVP